MSRRFPNSPSTTPLPNVSVPGEPIHQDPVPGPPSENAPPQLFVVWTGQNDISDTRRKSLDILRYTNLDIDFHLVTPDRLSEHLVANHPLHPAYDDLSFHHRADYLRAYFMHHHGGAYCDIKPLSQPWKPVLDRLNTSSKLWAGGMSAKALPSFAPTGQRIARTRRGVRSLHPGAIAFKPHSAWTHEWITAVERRIDDAAAELAAGQPVQPWGLNPEYPLAWDALSWEAFTPVARKYRAHSFTARSMRVVGTQGGFD